MKELLLALILAGVRLHSCTSSEQEENDSEVKYKGPVVYTNLPPPVLYFPNFPESSKISNRGSAGDTEDKRVEYVPFPYKDLPLLVYQSDKQPPVHVVEKSSNSNSDSDEPVERQSNSGYQTGPAVYRVNDNDQYNNQEADHGQHAPTANSGENFINVGLAAPQIPAIDTQNQQFISIGVTSIQPQGNDLNGQASSHMPQANALYNQIQYSSNENGDQGNYPPQSDEPLPQGSSNSQSSSFMYYSSQYPSQSIQTQSQLPVEQITQAIQNYLQQQSNLQLQAQSGIHQTAVSYPGKQDAYASASEVPTPQHVGITIIRQPPSQDGSEYGGNEPNYAPPPPRHPPAQNDQGYEENQAQYVSIGVYPFSIPGSDYNQDSPQYYNVMTPVSNDQYQSSSEDYRQSNQNYEKPPPAQNENAQTAGYQLISIDLSALKNQNPEQQRSVAPDYPQPVHRPPPPPPPPQNYRPQNDENSYTNREKAVQQIFIQIPQAILSDQGEKPTRERNPYETPYTGTAQVATVMRDPSKAPSGHPSNVGPSYKRPIHQRPPPPPSMHHSERPRNPAELFGFPQKGLLSNGINIAIIKQTDSSNNAPVYKPAVHRPPYHQPYHHQARAPTYPAVTRVPPPPNFRRPVFSHPSRPPPPQFNHGRDMVPFGSHHNPRYQSQPHFGQYRNKPVAKHFGGHPGIYAGSNQHYSSANPGVSQSLFGGAYSSVNGPTPFPQMSATKNQPQFMPNPAPPPLSSNAVGTETVMQAFSNGFGEISFDEINSFLSPSYDLFGTMTNGPDKKKVEEETKVLQKITGDLLIHDLNPPGLPAVPPPFGIVKPPPHILNAPFPYKYWEQPAMHPVPPGMVPGNDQTRFMNFYSHMQHPHIRNNRPFSSLGKGKGKKRGLGKGRLRSRLAALRTSIRKKSKIAPRQEVSDEGTDTLPGHIEESMTYQIAAPRSTIIKTEGPELDGITIPLNAHHVLSSRMSTGDSENEKEDKMPPIIVYKGVKPPVEIYGSKSDIEQASKENKTDQVATDGGHEEDDSSKIAPKPQAKPQSTPESIKASPSEGEGYLDYMYSILPDLIRDSFDRRLDGDTAKWLPVSPVEYAVAEDTYDRNETNTEKGFSVIQSETLKDSKSPQNSSAIVEPTVEESIEELFSLLGKEEKSEIVK